MAKSTAKKKTETSEVLELKKQEMRVEKMEKGAEDAPVQPPLAGIVDDMTPEQPEEERFVPEEQARAEVAGLTEADVARELAAILKVPKSRDSVMVFSMFSTGEFDRRYFLLDVDGNAYRKAWARYKELTGTKDTVQFLNLVYHILNVDMPRFHRNVDWVPLN